MGAQMTDQARSKARDQRDRTGIGGDIFGAVVRDRIVIDRAARIEKHVVRPPVTGRVVAQGELIARREIDIELGIRGIADLRSGVRSGEGSELCGGSEDQSLVAGLIVAGRIRPGASLRHNLHRPIEKFHYVRYAEVVLIESGKEKDFISLERAAERGSALLLLAVRLERHERSSSAAECAVANVIKAGAMPVVGPGLGDDVNNRAAGTSHFSSVGIGRDAELLHNFVRELVRSAIEAAGLREKCIIEIPPSTRKLFWNPRSPPKERSPLVAEVRLRGSCVTPGESSIRSEKRRPLSGRSPMARSSRSVETAVDSVSTKAGAPLTETRSRAPGTLSRN